LLGFVPKLPAKLPNPIASVRAAIASTLIAGLELARNAQVNLRTSRLSDGSSGGF
jgi:hypothetical protein